MIQKFPVHIIFNGGDRRDDISINQKAKIVQRICHCIRHLSPAESPIVWEVDFDGVMPSALKTSLVPVVIMAYPFPEDWNDIKKQSFCTNVYRTLHKKRWIHKSCLRVDKETDHIKLNIFYG